MIPSSRNERSFPSETLRQLEAQHAAVKRQGTLQVGQLAPAFAEIERLDPYPDILGGDLLQTLQLLFENYRKLLGGIRIMEIASRCGADNNPTRLIRRQTVPNRVFQRDWIFKKMLVEVDGGVNKLGHG